MSEATQPGMPVRVAEGPVVYLPREELGLIDVAVVLIRRWLFVVAGLIAIWLVTYWWLSKSPVRYESRGVVKIGHSRVSFPIIPTKEQQDVMLESAPVASKRIQQGYTSQSPLGVKYGGAYVLDTNFEKGADEILTVIARASSPELARDFLDGVLTDFVASHKSLYAEERNVMEQRLEVIDRERQRISTELKGLDETLNKPNQDAALLAVKQLTRAQFLQQQLSLEQEAVRLRREILNLQSPPTVRVSDPTLAMSPVEPRRTITWGLGTCLGLLLGCGLAFSIEFVEQVRQRLTIPR